MYSERYQDVSLRFANYVRSAVLCRHPRSSRWWSLWCYRGWTTETLCWSVFLPAYLVRCLQSVLNAAARLIYHMRSADHMTDVLVSPHWLRVPERIEYNIAVLTYKVLRGSAPRSLGPLARVTDQPGRRKLHSASSLLVPPVRLSTVGSRVVYSVTGPVSGTPCRKRRHQHHH